MYLPLAKLPYLNGPQIKLLNMCFHTLCTTEPNMSARVVTICLRATSHTRLGARDYDTSCTLIGGKGGASPSSLHATLEGPTEYVSARWM